MFSLIPLSGRGGHRPESKCHLDLKSNFFIWGGGGELHWPEPKCHLDLKSNFLDKFQIGSTIGSFILGREGGFKLDPILAVSFWGGRGHFKLGPLLAVSFWGGREGGGYICR